MRGLVSLDEHSVGVIEASGDEERLCVRSFFRGMGSDA